MSDHHPSSFMSDANLRIIGNTIGLTSTSIVREIAAQFGDSSEEDDFRELHIDTVPIEDDEADGPRILVKYENGRAHYAVEVGDLRLAGRSLRIHLRRGRQTPRIVEAYTDQELTHWQVLFDEKGRLDEVSISGRGHDRPNRSSVEFLLSTVGIVDTALRHARGQ